MLKAVVSIVTVVLSFRFAASGVEPPVPFGPVPSARQLQWHELEFCGFIHFSMNTFTDKEWGYGDESESLFNPTDFDADQIVSTAAAGGMKALVLTCKHHDGFCLWPSKFTEHSVKRSPWKNGKGDMVKEFADACRRHGLKFGVYLSPWDRSRADYGRPEYITYFRNQLRELLTNYGPVFEVWFDGANGGDGYYGGAREKRTINRKTYYEWPNTWKLIRHLQPDACIWSDAGPDIRWAGNEIGRANQTCWATLKAADFAPGEADAKRLSSGDRPGTDWVPADCDVSIRPGWFYHAKEDAKVKSADALLEIYFKSVGHGASLLLNLPPDRRGKIHENDVTALTNFHNKLEAIFAHNLASDARAVASSRGNDARFAAPNVLDDRRETYWATDDAVTNAELVLEFKQPVTFNIVRLREYLPLGQRIEGFALDSWQVDCWVEFGRGTSVGNCRLIRGRPLTTNKIRLRILQAAACPALSELGVFAE